MNGTLNRTLGVLAVVLVAMLAYRLSVAQLEGMEPPTDVTGVDCRMCHTDVGVNFAFPHAPAFENNCTACHLTTGETGHGGLIADGRELCLSCHQDREDHYPAATCYSAGCHADVHGSAVDELLIPSRTEEYPGFFEATADADFVGSGACISCHSDYCGWWEETAHSLSDEDDKKSCDMKGCEGCHGAGGDHYGRRAGIGIFTEAYSDEVDTVCLKCHRDEMYLPDYEDSRHVRSHVSCVSCHNPHNLTEKHNLKLAANEVCMSCHETKRADFLRLSRHPIDTADARTGMLCVECHNPHGSTYTAMLKLPPGELCLSCHVDKAGPFVYPHVATDPTIGRGCATCHTHHGSNSPDLLVISGRGLCLQCHTEQAVNHGGGQTCWTSGCHSEHHGNNENYFFLK